MIYVWENEIFHYQIANFGINVSTRCVRYHWVVVLAKYRNLAQRMACYSFFLLFLLPYSHYLVYFETAAYFIKCCMPRRRSRRYSIGCLINYGRVNDLIFEFDNAAQWKRKSCANIEMKFTIHSSTRLRDSFRLMLRVYWFQLTNNPLFPFTKTLASFISDFHFTFLILSRSKSSLFMGKISTFFITF